MVRAVYLFIFLRYNMYGYIYGVLRTQHEPEDLIEMENSQNWTSHIIRIVIGFYALIQPRKSHKRYLQMEVSLLKNNLRCLLQFGTKSPLA